MSIVLDYIAKKGPCTMQEVAKDLRLSENHCHTEITDLIESGQVENNQNDVFIGEEAGIYLFDKSYKTV